MIIKVRNPPYDAMAELIQRLIQLKEEYVGRAAKDETYVSFRYDTELIQEELRQKYHSNNLIIMGLPLRDYASFIWSVPQIAKIHQQYFPNNHEQKDKYTYFEVNRMLNDLDLTDAILRYTPFEIQYDEDDICAERVFVVGKIELEIKYTGKGG